MYVNNIYNKEVQRKRARQTTGGFVVNEFRSQYETTNHTNIYQMCRAIMNLEHRLDALDARLNNSNIVKKDDIPSTYEPILKKTLVMSTSIEPKQTSEELTIVDIDGHITFNRCTDNVYELIDSKSIVDASIKVHVNGSMQSTIFKPLIPNAKRILVSNIDSLGDNMHDPKLAYDKKEKCLYLVKAFTDDQLINAKEPLAVTVNGFTYPPSVILEYEEDNKELSRYTDDNVISAEVFADVINKLDKRIKNIENN